MTLLFDRVKRMYYYEKYIKILIRFSIGVWDICLIRRTIDEHYKERERNRKIEQDFWKDFK